MRRYFLFLWVSALFLFGVSSAWSQPRFGAPAAGRLAFNAAQRYLKAPPYKRGELKARVFAQNFQQLSPSRGSWSGLIEGNGTIHLRLNILRNGSIVSSRYMGCIEHATREKPTPFKFISPLPKGRWTWRITAQAL